MCFTSPKYLALKPLMPIEQDCHSLSEPMNKHVQKLNPRTGLNILFLNFDKVIIVKSNNEWISLIFSFSSNSLVLLIVTLIFSTLMIL